MALYGIALLPLAELLRKECAELLQPWYADDAAMQGMARAVAKCFKLLIKIGPHFGDRPEPEKSFAICPLAAETEAKAIFEEEGLPVQFCRGHRYVGGYVGSRAMADRWVEPKVEAWVEGIKALSMVARSIPRLHTLASPSRCSLSGNIFAAVCLALASIWDLWRMPSGNF